MHRRDLLRGVGVVAATGAVGAGVQLGRSRPATARARSETRELTAPAEPIGSYVYLPFSVPSGVNRIEGRIVERAGASTGLGLFDQRGPQYGSPGFRGLYGGELGAFTVATDRASRSFLPGPVEPGEWTVIVPMFSNPMPGGEIRVDVTLHFGPQGEVLRPGAPVGVVRDEAGWYRGDLHCHTPQSSDAYSSGSAMTPRQWAEECRRVGLHFAAMTDHNVVSQNFALADAAGRDVLLLAGEEMTNFFHGHATVSGIQPGEWLDWRQRPSGVPLMENEARIDEFIRTAREMGAYTSAAHPLAPLPGLPWQFFEDEALNPQDPAFFPDGIEVWTGDFQPDDEQSLQKWDEMLRRGRRVAANGGSDLHGVVNALQPGYAGGPTTVVYAERLATADLVRALRAGRSFITRAPNGGELYLTARGPDEQATYTGGTIHGGASDTVEIEVLVRRGALLAGAPSLRLVLLRDGAPLSVTPITEQQQTVTATVPVGIGGYVRAELRGAPFIDDRTPTNSRLDMEAFTNPIFLSTAPRPDDAAPETAPPPTATGERVRSHLRDAAAGVGVLTARAAPRVASALAALGGPRRSTLSAVAWRAALDDGLRDVEVRLVGQVTGVTDDEVALTRWLRDCCARDGRPTTVRLRGLPAADAAPVVGDWLEVDARWAPPTGADFAEPPLLEVTASRSPARLPDRYEG